MIQSPAKPRPWLLPSLLGFIALVGIGMWLFSKNQKPMPEVSRDELELKEGRLYRKGEGIPFSGVMIDHYPDKSPKSRSLVKEGKLNGASEGYYTNGTMQVREWFKDGVSHGERRKWHENGTNQSVAEISGGQLHGKFKRWHEDGTLAEEMTLRGGTNEGLAVSYFNNGFIKGAALFKEGKMVEQKFWKEGEMKELPPEFKR